MQLSLLRVACLILVTASCPVDACLAAEFSSRWDTQHDRVWIGPEYWSNPLEDWRLRDGRVECISSQAGRSLHLLTHQLGEAAGTLEASVVVGLIEDASAAGREGSGSAGFGLGIRSELGDYRSSLIFGNGQSILLTSRGELLLNNAPLPVETNETAPPDISPEGLLRTGEGVRLRLTLTPQADNHDLTVVLERPTTGEVLRRTSGKVSIGHKELIGNLALLTNAETERPGRRRAPNTPGNRFWFRDLHVGGTRVVESPDHAFGPILYAMYTLSRGTMTMTAQMPPLGDDDGQSVVLQVPVDVASALLGVPEVASTSVDGWASIARSTIDPLSCTAHFRITGWPDTQDIPYRLEYTLETTAGQSTATYFAGTIRKDPVDKPEIAVAGFTGHQHNAFPNELLVRNVAIQDPDLLFFSGDQIYENAGGFGIIRGQVNRATLNYLRKIWLWGWSFRDVLKDRPSFVLPDDHDVYQGNIWGQGGKPVPGGINDHAQGGFAEPPDFVNAVFRTQCGHHPPAYDPTPMLQGIDCWYGDCVYGRISFAVIEDRYFKSGPEGKVNTWSGRPDHVKDPHFDTRVLDQDGLILLGDRQLRFLDDWAADWSGADMKCVCSQTIFANVANYHGGEQEYIYGDLDSNGWPQAGRNRAVDALRRGFAFHYTGDQHLPSIIQYGIDEWRDAGFSFCVPSTAAGYPRSWRPDDEGRAVRNRMEPELPNTGDYLDSFQNKVTVYAIANPAKKNRQPVLELLHDKSSGYGMVRFNKPAQTITMECWKLIFDAANPRPEDQFVGWPRTIHLRDNYPRSPTGHLPTLAISGRANPVVQIVDESASAIVYTLRINGTSFRPPVFSSGPFTIRVGDGDGWQQTMAGVRPAAEGATIDVTLE